MAIDLTYIVPVYNALPDLQRTAESLIGQDYDPDAYEVVFVDDGSDDGSSEYLAGIAESKPNVHVMRIERSGGPSTPRNVGLAHARGEYVFFCDADDWMEKDATSRMLGHASEWHPDVMLVKPKGERGRRIAAGAFERTLPKADIYLSDVGQALGPCKLFRRDFLQGNGLAFTFDLPVWEDQPFALKSYLLANCVSVAADGVYCHWLGGVDGSSSQARDRVSFKDVCRYLKEMFDLVSEFGSIEGAKKVIIPRILREGLFYAGRALLRERGEEGDRHMFDELRELVDPFLTDEFYKMCNVQRSFMYRAFCAGDMQAWMRLCSLPSDDPAFKSAPLVANDDGSMALVWDAGACTFAIDAAGRLPLEYRVDHVGWHRDDFVISGLVAEDVLRGYESLALRLVKRDMGEWVEVPADVSRDDRDFRVTCAVSPTRFVSEGRSTYWDAHLVARYANGRQTKRRVELPEALLGSVGTVHSVADAEGLPEGLIAIMPYRTVKGNLSLVDCLRVAKLEVPNPNRLLGSPVAITGVPSIVFRTAGGIDVTFATDKGNRTVHLDADGKGRTRFRLAGCKPLGIAGF